MVYDVSDLHAPFYVTHINTRQGTSGDLGPEALTFIPGVRSPNKQPLLVVCDGVGGTTAIFRIRLH